MRDGFRSEISYAYIYIVMYYEHADFLTHSKPHALVAFFSVFFLWYEISYFICIEHAFSLELLTRKLKIKNRSRAGYIMYIAY